MTWKCSAHCWSTVLLSTVLTIRSVDAYICCSSDLHHLKHCMSSVVICCMHTLLCLMPYLHQVHAYLLCAACWFAVMTCTCNRNEQSVIWLHPSAPAIVIFCMHIICAGTSCLGLLTCLLQGCTALYHAAANGSADAARMLCHWGGDVNASDAVVCSIIPR